MIEIKTMTVPHAYRNKYMRAGYAKGKYGKNNSYNGNYISGDTGSSGYCGRYCTGSDRRSDTVWTYEAVL